MAAAAILKSKTY